METEKETNIDEEKVNWLQDELQELDKVSSFNGEKLPALELPPNKNTTFEVNSSKPFEKWIDPNDGTVKKIIPVTQGQNKFVLWINTRNPVYRQMVERLSKGQTQFTIFRTGEKQNTRYNIVDE